ncbi:beta-type carbonic anhydrase-like protein [Corynebacterium kutscheri]|uniref:Carbonic anhydrase n=1 Tax=Corynebacterium kutscheri TaxID=35755 RepID=A0A0F6TD13_9CORY|nr:carbonic anhydrase [Corynebacterium kutscheri]AKE40751.1 carbonic anhydrase [Corynebacterium kutscheri]VEH04574.1 beta-type carbonic anhydrase-like protein [Corynebacterium kutscheri]VEH11149.1 beta-type carbonic anhydrase-like protein [Corynebacterium kutscheri]VEH80374.1 beta-type carbonic anhydrase-like protein [Corynebacterium kutscheri]
MRDPQAVWASLLEGNARFVAGTPHRPNQDQARRLELTGGQSPRMAVFTCGDSRVPVEILFDVGLGDVFVVRTAGEVIDSGVLASLEFAIVGLGVEVVVVLGHESCGAVKAALSVIEGGEVPGGHQRTLVEQITPSILEARSDGKTSMADFERHHAEETVRRIIDTSPVIAKAVEKGDTRLIAARYRLSDGAVEELEVFS